jgi:hypothetical protein
VDIDSTSATGPGLLAQETADASAFASAVAALRPFFDRQRTWSGSHLELSAYRALRDHHPELTVAQAYVIVLAARRVYAARPPAPA